MEHDRLLKLLLGRALRVHLATWVLDNGPVFAEHDVIEDLGGRGVASGVRQELTKMVELGMVAPAPTDERRNYYQALDSPLWDIFRVTRDAVVRHEQEQGEGDHTERR